MKSEKQYIEILRIASTVEQLDVILIDALKYHSLWVDVPTRIIEFKLNKELDIVFNRNKNTMKTKLIKILKDCIKDGLEDNEVILINSIIKQINDTPLSFETEYQLQGFREIQKDHFNKDGKAYKSVISTHLCERMLLLINQLESEF